MTIRDSCFFFAGAVVAIGGLILGEVGWGWIVILIFLLVVLVWIARQWRSVRKIERRWRE